MTTAIVLLVVWAIIMVVSFYAGILSVWVAIAARILNGHVPPKVRNSKLRGGIVIGILSLFLSGLSAVFVALQIYTIIQLATA
jgi:hypothetical protein